MAGTPITLVLVAHAVLAVMCGRCHDTEVAKSGALPSADPSSMLSFKDLARDLGVSVTSFHQRFKTVTAMMPRQFPMQLHLQDARGLMLGEGYDATTACNRVRYDDASHFTRALVPFRRAANARRVAAARGPDPGPR